MAQYESPEWPGNEAIKHHLKKIREGVKIIHLTGIDKPWNIFTLSKHELPSGTLPIVLFMRNHVYIPS